MRLIDADKLIFESTRGNSSPEDIGFWDGVFYASAKMLSAPTVDAVEVVRCKDCDYYILGLCIKICSDGIIRKDVFCKREKDDFCNYGRKKR